MTNLFTNLSKNGSEPVNGSRMDRHNIENGPIHLRQLFAVLVMMLCLGVGNMWGTADYTYSLASGDFTTTTHAKTSGTITWTHEHGAGDESYGWDSDYKFKFGSGNKSYPTSFTLTSSSFSSKIKKVVVTASVNSGKSCKLDVTVGSTTYGEQETINTKNNDTWEFSIADGSAVNGAIELSFSSNTGPLYLNKIEVYYLAGCTDGTITYSKGSTTYTGGNTISGSHASDTKVCSTNLTLPGATFTTTGYTQDGWATSDGGDKVYNLGATNYSTEGNATLYPHWAINNYTVTWMSNGSQHTTTSVSYGSKPTFPSNPSSCDATSDTFYGWSTTAWAGALDDVSDKTIYTDASAMPAVTGAVTYYAVFAKAVKSDNFQLLTSSSNFISGEDYLIESYFSSTDHVLKAANYSGYSYQQTSENSWTLPSSGVNFDMSSKSDLCIWKITSEGNNQFSIYNASANKYLVLVKVSTYDNLILSATKDASFIRTVVKEDGYSDVFKFESSAISGKHLYCAGSYWYAYTSAEEVYLYKRVTTYSKYLTNCCTNLGSINGSFF